MANFNTDTQVKTGFFHALGYVLTKFSNAPFNEQYKSSHNIQTKDIWADTINYSFDFASAESEAVSNSAVTQVGDVAQKALLYPLKNSDRQAWFLDTGTPTYDTNGFIPSEGWVKPLISPVDVTNAAGAPSLGFSLKLYQPNGTEISPGNGRWEVDYYSGIIKFQEGYTPTDTGNGLQFDFDVLLFLAAQDKVAFLETEGPRAIAFQYTGQYLSDASFGTGGGSYSLLSVATESNTGVGLAADVYQGLTESSGITTFNIKGIRAGDDSIIITQDDNNVYIQAKPLEPPTATWTLTDLTCYQSADGEIVIDAAGGTAEKRYSIDGGSTWLPVTGFTTSTTATFSNLDAGSYTLVVFDGGLFFNTLNQPVTLTQPNAVTFTRTITNVTTITQNDGAITINASGGTSPYEYSIDNGLNYQTSNQFTSLSAGTYILSVTDVNGCLSSTQSVTITGPEVVSISNVTANDPNCPEGNGSIVIQVQNGSGLYQFSTDNGVTFEPTNGSTSTTYTIVKSSGTYNVVIKDFNTNETDTWGSNPVVITDPVGKSISEFIENDGLGGNPASIDITVVDVYPSATAPRWSLDNVTFYNFTTNNGLGSWSTTIGNSFFVNGTNTGVVYITDSCPVALTQSYTVEKTAGISATVLSTTRPACPTDDWVYTFTVSGGSGTFDYSLDNIDWFSYTSGGDIIISQSTNQVSASSTTIYFRDANNTSNVITRSVTNSAVLDLQISLTPNIASCFGGTTTLVANVTGGEIGVTNTFEYALVTGGIIGAYVSSTSTSRSYTITSNNTYAVRVRRNVNGSSATSCEVVSSNQSITLPTEITYSISTTDPTSCGVSGTASVTISGGTGTYEYRINSGSWISLASEDISLNPGTYTLTFRDSNGCVTTGQSVTINAPAGVNFTITYAKPDCNGGQATISVTPTSGTQPFTINPPAGWTRVGTGTINLNDTIQYTGTPTTSSVSFEVVDSASCSNTKSVTGTGEPTVVTLSNITGVTDGGLTGNISGGTSPYLLEVRDSGTNNEITSSPFNINTSFTLTSTQIPVGSYNVVGIDNNSCRSATVSVSVDASGPPDLVYIFKFRLNATSPNIYVSNGSQYSFSNSDIYYDSTNSFAVTSISTVVNYYMSNLSLFSGESVDISSNVDWDGVQLDLGSLTFGGFNVAVVTPSSKNFSSLLSGNRITDNNGASYFNASTFLNVTINGTQYDLYNIYGTSQVYTTKTIIID